MNWYSNAQTDENVEAAASSKGYKGPFWHGTNEVKSVIRDHGVPGDPSAKSRIDEIKEQFKMIAEERFPEIWETKKMPSNGDIPSILQRWGLDELANEMREAMKQMRGIPAKMTLEPAFNSFEFGEFGFHFGTKTAAEMMGTAFPFYIKMRNTIRLPDLGTWNWQSVVREIRKLGIRVSEKEYDRIFNSGNEEAEARNLLLSKGVDSIIYKNEVEGFHDSWLILSPYQIKLALPVTYDDEGNPIKMSERFNSSSADFRY